MSGSKSKRALDLPSSLPHFSLSSVRCTWPENRFYSEAGDKKSLCGTGEQAEENVKQKSFIWSLTWKKAQLHEFLLVRDSLWVCCFFLILLFSFSAFNILFPFRYSDWIKKKKKKKKPSEWWRSLKTQIHLTVLIERHSLENGPEWMNQSMVINTKTSSTHSWAEFYKPALEKVMLTFL